MTKKLIEILYDAEGTPEAQDGWTAWNGGECPIPNDARVIVKFRGGDEDVASFVAGELRWGHRGIIGDILAYRVVSQPTAANTHTVYHDGEVYRKSTILLQTSQLVVWSCDGQEYAVKAHQAMIDPDDDQVAAALMSGITGHDIAPEHITELRAQMGWGVPVDG